MSTANTVVDEQVIDSDVPDAPAHEPTPTKIYLKDYQPPVFAVEHIDLDIKLFDDHALVDSQLVMYREHEGELWLAGQDLQLLSISMNERLLTEADYTLDEQGLSIHQAPDRVTLNIQVRIEPQKNTALEGLYLAGDQADKQEASGVDIEQMYVTQCEPEGFRKITFYPDRPDVLATFTTRLEADKKFPTLLANGNLIDSGAVGEHRHYALWEDPTRKPSYLFACVFADLDVMQDHYTTIEGREVLLELYAKSYDIEKCHVAMQALKDAMAWDEKNYGRAYDLDRYMIVAVSQFNMGAMENKGLNIFNTACVLSSPETTTDNRSFNVKAVVAHEYFHNWTGNRITCRDWFQLCLKEGFTVYRDQSFSADQQSPAVQRIDDVATLRAHQFSEDAGPLAHPPRPDNFVEINNFYTTTVYEKGAEVVRMIANTLGKEGFRRGTDEYFKRYDGQAVTVEDFLSALSVADKRAEDFLIWYTQPATPHVSGYHDYDAKEQCLTIRFTQKTRHVAGYAEPKLLPIPIAVALFDSQSGAILAEEVLLLTEQEQQFAFTDIQTTDNTAPIVSVLRNFSAPVQLSYDYTDEDLAFLVAHETNGFNQWQHAQTLVNRVLLQHHKVDSYLSAIEQAVARLSQTDAMLTARLFDIPSERELATAFSTEYRPEQVKKQRKQLKTALAERLKPQLSKLYQQLPIQEYVDTPEANGQRALRNVVLDMALTAGIDEAPSWAYTQYDTAKCMTERLGALQAIIFYDLSKKDEYLQDFYQRFANEALVIDLWFSVQASNPNTQVQHIESLIAHQKFDWGTPNRIRAVVSSLASQPTLLWSEQGLDLYTQVVAKLDKTNPVLASRLLQALARWYTLEQSQQVVAKRYLTALRSKVSSKNTLESLQHILTA
ncbi:aminopeptidase N [Psychrobacter sp. I-STPA6b]|uniref:aminopeptidase N n=1 Tax=Psychrobacter sp. I-STPA6b TaxID=2585718 RepID=UPI001D0C3D6A|nr:aminopeptidase N [Psychrobacter sp. I-STPA6b]